MVESVFFKLHPNILHLLVIFLVLVQLETMKVRIGVGYTGSSLGFSTFHFFSIIFDIVITKAKKFFKNIDLKKIPSQFTVCAAGRADFRLQNLTKHHNPDISAHKTTLRDLNYSQMV